MQSRFAKKKMDHILFPRFWKEEPALWFAQIEAVFALNNITSDQAKYDYILCELPNNVISLIKDLILDSTSEFENGKYQRIKKELVKRIAIVELEKQGIGLMKPSEFYKSLKEKADPRISENIIKEIWMKKLPLQVNYVICDMKGCDIESACKLADTVYEYIPVQCQINKNGVTSGITKIKSSEVLEKQFESIDEELLKFKIIYKENTSHLEKILAELYKFRCAYKENKTRLDNIEAELRKIRPNCFVSENCEEKNSNEKKEELDITDENSENDKSSIVSLGEEVDDQSENIESDKKEENNENNTKSEVLCWYHNIYGDNAHNCLAPCNFKSKLTDSLK